MSSMRNSVDESSTAPSDSPCAICLGKVENKCFANNCLHEFCYSCLFRWSKEKTKCPLCMQPFSSIIHNIRSNNDYDEQTIQSTDDIVSDVPFLQRFLQFILSTQANLQTLESTLQTNSDSRHSGHIHELRQALLELINERQNIMYPNSSAAIVDNLLDTDNRNDIEIVEVMRRGRFHPIFDEITLSDDE
ncbi:E3 ubiquitin-protein ligase Topors-like [Daphnia pulex]|uniref:E3 ubiquitin-protein ligase Topors-like n=1 Tax=Daphnia pulex TaxID=6669 RepID=UPI001EDE6591|nr:E3 ubiquitin-protein ligase Topors-like [Daphnia pulex]